jgi:hypothetical protein
MFGCLVGMMDRNMWMPFDLRAFEIYDGGGGPRDVRKGSKSWNRNG